MASLYRSGVWFLHGWWNYGRAGYERAAKRFDATDLNVDLNGRVAVVTGANSGLGLETSFELAQRGAKVYMLCRSVEKADAAIKSLISRPDSIENLQDNFVIKQVDVSLQADIKSFAKEFDSFEEKLDILVNNAGCMIDGRPLTGEGVETNFATNVIGPYLLTESLIPFLRKGREPIVLTVTSGGMLTQKLEPVDIQLASKDKGIEIYAQNKRQQVELTHYWVQKYKDSGIFFCTAHPGWADTAAVRTSMPDFYAKFGKQFRTPKQGADTIIWAVVSETAKRSFPNGSFFEDRKAVKEHLPLSWTASTDTDREAFVKNLEALINK